MGYFDIAIQTSASSQDPSLPQVFPFPSFLFTFISFWMHKGDK